MRPILPRVTWYGFPAMFPCDFSRWGCAIRFRAIDHAKDHFQPGDILKKTETFPEERLNPRTGRLEIRARNRSTMWEVNTVGEIVPLTSRMCLMELLLSRLEGFGKG